MNCTNGSAALDLTAPDEAHDAPDPTSAPLLRVLAGGRDDAFDAELAAHGRRLLPRAIRLTRNRDDAEDLVNETVLRALRFRATYRNGTNMLAWLNQILFSVFATHCRRRTRERRAMEWLATDPCAWSRSDAAPAMQTLSPAMMRALEALPENFSRLLLLVDVGEMAYRDAADTLGIPVGTVMSRLFRARKMLAAQLADSRLS